MLSRDHCGDSPERPSSGLLVSSFIAVFQVKGPHSEKCVFYLLPITLWSFWESKKEK